MQLPYTINKPLEALSWLMLLAMAISAFYFYAHFPVQVPTHWSVSGTVDGYSSRAVAAFVLPAIAIGAYLLITFMPLIDPKKARYAEFSKTYNIVRFFLALMFVFLYAVSSLAGIGYNIPVGTVIPLAIGILFIILGNYLPKVKPNWFMGIRTPWTLSSETVWYKTHRLGGKLFTVIGIVFMIIPTLPPVFVIPVFVGAVLLMTIGTIAYSYWVFRSEKK